MVIASQKRRRRRTILAILLGVALAIVFVLDHGPEADREPVAASSESKRTTFPAIQSEKKSGVFAMRTAAKEALPAPVMRGNTQIPPDAVAEYLKARSVRRFIERYLPQALAGDGAAAYAVSLAINDCWFVTY